MADMRVVVAGAGGRMGRNLIRAVSEAAGLSVVGALEQPGSPFVGQDAGVMAGTQASGLEVRSDPLPMLSAADAIIAFTREPSVASAVSLRTT